MKIGIASELASWLGGLNELDNQAVVACEGGWRPHARTPNPAFRRQSCSPIAGSFPIRAAIRSKPELLTAGGQVVARELQQQRV